MDGAAVTAAGGTAALPGSQRTAARFGADLVVLATHGLGASQALHGSVTKTGRRKIRRPLLVIRRPEE